MFLEISQNSQENTCARVSFLIKLLASSFIEKETLVQVLSGEFCETSKNTFFTELVWENDSFNTNCLTVHWDLDYRLTNSNQKEKRYKYSSVLNPLQNSLLFYTPWKHQKTVKFTVFRGYRKAKPDSNVLSKNLPN